MKRLILTIAFFSVSSTFATTEVLKKQIPVADSMGNFAIDLDFAFDRPLIESIHMNLNVVCKERRAQPNAAKPQTEKLMVDERICALDDSKFDSATKILTLRYSTGHFKKEVASCEEHWKQTFDLKEICEAWGDGNPRKPSSEVAEGLNMGWQPEGAVAGQPARRGVGRRERVRGKDYYNSAAREQNPTYDTNSIYSGSLFGTYPQQQQQRQSRGLDGLPRNSRGEVIRCPGLEGAIASNTQCLSAIIAAESSCNAGVKHSGHGIGLCAIENDKRRFRFGSACSSVSSTQAQINCCEAIYSQVGMAYFGSRTRRIAYSACSTASR